jgi:hypothetical protein
MQINCLEMLLLVFLLFTIYKNNNLEFMDDSKMAKINSKVDKSSNKEGGIVIGGNNESVSGVNQKKEGIVTQTAPKSNPKKKTFKKSKKPAGGADNMLIYLAIGGIIYFMYFHKK